MTPQRRGVRFSMNAGRRPPEPVPPKPVPPSSPPPKERVLHSIFSPSYNKGKEETRGEITSDFHSPPRTRYLTASEDGPVIVGATLSTQSQNLSPISAISAFTAGTSHWQQEKTQRARITPFSDDALNTSVDTLNTIEMLNFKFIRSCDSIENLERILKVLSNTKKDSPLLFQETKDRLKALRQMQHEQNGFRKSVTSKALPHPLYNENEVAGETEFEESPGKEYFYSYAANISRITNGNSTLDSIDPTKASSLNLTLSPQSVLHGVDFVDDTSSAEEIKLFIPAPTMNSTSSPNEAVVKEHRLSPIEERMGRRPVPPPPPPPPKPIETRKSPEEVQVSFLQKLQSLEAAKKSADEVVKSLQTQVQQANNSTKHMQGVVEEMKKEKKHQNEKLEKERQIFQEHQRKASTVERGLQERVSTLIEQLRETEEKARLVMSAEKKIRVETEKQLSKVQEKNHELNAMLEKAKQNLESMKQRQASFRMELFRCMGLSIDEVSVLRAMFLYVRIFI